MKDRNGGQGKMFTDNGHLAVVTISSLGPTVVMVLDLKKSQPGTLCTGFQVITTLASRCMIGWSKINQMAEPYDKYTTTLKSRCRMFQVKVCQCLGILQKHWIFPVEKYSIHFVCAGI